MVAASVRTHASGRTDGRHLTPRRLVVHNQPFVKGDFEFRRNYHSRHRVPDDGRTPDDVTRPKLIHLPHVERMPFPFAEDFACSHVRSLIRSLFPKRVLFQPRRRLWHHGMQVYLAHRIAALWESRADRVHLRVHLLEATHNSIDILGARDFPELEWRIETLKLTRITSKYAIPKEQAR